MLGAAGVRESRAGVRIIGWRLHVRFRACCCPPARDVPLRIAHFHAAASQARFSTMAVAPACGNTTKQCGCVREECERAAQKDDSEEVYSMAPAHRYILGKLWGKTDSPGVQNLVTKVLEPVG